MGVSAVLLMGGVNVPFLVRWPGVVPAGRVDKETALAGVDVFPTLLAAAGIPSPHGYVSDGENMLSGWMGQTRQQRTKPVFWWWQGKHTGDDWPAFAMRDGPWVLILDETKERSQSYTTWWRIAQSQKTSRPNNRSASPICVPQSTSGSRRYPRR